MQTQGHLCGAGCGVVTSKPLWVQSRGVRHPLDHLRSERLNEEYDGRGGAGWGGVRRGGVVTCYLLLAADSWLLATCYVSSR